MIYSKVFFVLLISIAFVSAIPQIGGEADKVISCVDNGIGGITGIVEDLLNQNGQILFGLLGGKPAGLDLSILENLIDITQILVDFLGKLPKNVLKQVNKILAQDLPVGQIVSKLKVILNKFGLGDLLPEIVAEVLKIVQKLLQAIQKLIGTTLPKVLQDLTKILSGKKETIAEQLADLRGKSQVEVDTILFIASQLAKQPTGGVKADAQAEAKQRIRIRTP